MPHLYLAVLHIGMQQIPAPHHLLQQWEQECLEQKCKNYYCEQYTKDKRMQDGAYLPVVKICLWAKRLVEGSAAGGGKVDCGNGSRNMTSLP